MKKFKNLNLPSLLVLSSIFLLSALQAEIFVNSLSCPRESHTLSVPNRTDPATGGVTITRCSKEAIASLVDAAKAAGLTQLDAHLNEESLRYKKVCRVTLNSDGHWDPNVSQSDVLSPSHVLCER